MTEIDFAYGPVDLLFAAFEDARPDPAVLGALADLVEAGQVRLLDMLLVARDANGALTFTDVDAGGDLHESFAEVQLVAPGLVAHEDAAQLAAKLPPGASGTLVAIELTWARTLANRMAESGGVVLDSARIPAPIVNAIMDSAPARGAAS